jgi:hypothetical protein
VRLALALTAVVLAILSGVAAAGQAPSVAAGFHEHVLGDSNGLKVVAWARSEARFGDEDWLQIEIINSGRAATIKAAAVDAPAQSNASFNSSNILSSLTLGIPSGDRAKGPVIYTLPAGRYVTRAPGILAGTHLRLRATPVDVTMRLALKLSLDDGRSFATSAPSPIAFRWVPPSPERLDALRRQAVALLERAIPGESQLSPVEAAQMHALLQDLTTAQGVTVELALAALAQRQREGSFRFSEVTGLVCRRWPNDPKVIGFYRDALVARGAEGLADLASTGACLWDASFVEPVIKILEAADPGYSVLSNGLMVLDRRYASWSQDSSIPPRLSRSVLNAQPVAMPNGMYNWMDLLALAHDRAMIAVLRPFLADRTIDQFTSQSSNMPGGVTPMRYSELAANAICRLLAEPIMFDPWKRAAAPRGGPYPEWAEWDRKIAALQERLRGGRD